MTRPRWGALQALARAVQDQKAALLVLVGVPAEASELTVGARPQAKRYAFMKHPRQLHTFKLIRDLTQELPARAFCRPSATRSWPRPRCWWRTARNSILSLGFKLRGAPCPQAKRYAFMAEAAVLVADSKADPAAGAAMSALVRAMDREQQVACACGSALA